MRVSVVLLTYNRLAMLKVALGSVFAQTFRDREVIVVDAGSSDGTTRHVRGLAGRGVELVALRGNPGLSGMMNAGVARARGRLVAFLQADDYWAAGYLAAMTRSFRDPRVQVAASSWWLVDEAGEPFRRFEDRDLRLLTCPPVGVRVGRDGRFQTVHSFNSIVYRLGVCHVSFAVFRRSVFAEVGGFDDAILWTGVDADLLIRIALRHGPAAFWKTDRPLGYWRRHHDGQLSARIDRIAAPTGRFPDPASLSRQDREILLDGAYLTRKYPPEVCRTLGERLDAGRLRPDDRPISLN